MANQLMQIDHIVHLMLENRSFDHMLGFLYQDDPNKDFKGLTGNETNEANGKPCKVFPIDKLPFDQWYHQPGTDPGEGLGHYDAQMFGRDGKGKPASGYAQDFADEIKVREKAKHPNVLPYTAAGNIMGAYTPLSLPILSALARNFAVCDEWYCSGPIHTWPNRAFAAAATSQGEIANISVPGWLTTRTIYDSLDQMKQKWKIYGPYGTASQTRTNFQGLLDSPPQSFCTMEGFITDAKAGALPAYSFIEPDFAADGTSQHPNHDVLKGDVLIAAVYAVLRSSPCWNKTLFIITYDEHGGMYDHLPPTATAAAPGDFVHGAGGFDFTRFGPRVPAVLVSPLIAPGSVFRVPGQTIDHTSVLKTLFERWGGNDPLYLTNRDAAAPSLGDVLTLATPRDDDPLATVKRPTPPPPPPGLDLTVPSMLDLVHAEQVAQLPALLDDGTVEYVAGPLPTTAQALRAFVIDRVQRYDSYRASVAVKQVSAPVNDRGGRPA